MNSTILKHLFLATSIAAVTLFAVGCGNNSDSDQPLMNNSPGNNNLNVVVAFGDSITKGSECSCVPYPARLAGMIGKAVHNTGIGGSAAEDSVGRTQAVINKFHPAYMLIMYGVNDIIHSRSDVNTAHAVHQMVLICKQNNVVPVVMTYPVPILGHRIFAGGTIRLNARIREIAALEGIKCVDLEKEFSAGEDPMFPGRPTTSTVLMDADGLHPNDAGTQLMALACADLF